MTGLFYFRNLGYRMYSIGFSRCSCPTLGNGDVEGKMLVPQVSTSL